MNRSVSRNAIKLSPEVNRVLYVRNLPYKITVDEMYAIFDKYGPIFQIRLGDTKDTKGTAFVVYEDIFDAKSAVENLTGICVCGRYLVVLYYQPARYVKSADLAARRQELEDMKSAYGVSVPATQNSSAK
jgi:pre-mRNA branch site protein p14